MPPMMTPSTMKVLRIAPSVAPRALRMAISFAFSAIIRSSVQTIEKLATMISIDRMRNVAILSSFSALNRFLQKLIFHFILIGELPLDRFQYSLSIFPCFAEPSFRIFIIEGMEDGGDCV